MAEIKKRTEKKVKFVIDKTKPVKIDLGSGINYYKGKNNDEIDEWVHVDGDSASHVEIVCDFAEEIPIETGIADEVHSSEVLEHITPWDEAKIMGEFNRIMKIGCTFIGTTPSFKYSCEQFILGKMTYNDAQANLYGDRFSHHHCHYRTFTEETLVMFLEKWGFGDIMLSGSPGLPSTPWWLVFECKKIKNV